jgi:hypothetical protein
MTAPALAEPTPTLEVPDTQVEPGVGPVLGPWLPLKYSPRDFVRIVAVHYNIRGVNMAARRLLDVILLTNLPRSQWLPHLTDYEGYSYSRSLEIVRLAEASLEVARDLNRAEHRDYIRWTEDGQSQTDRELQIHTTLAAGIGPLAVVRCPCGCGTFWQDGVAVREDGTPL